MAELTKIVTHEFNMLKTEQGLIHVCFGALPVEKEPFLERYDKQFFETDTTTLAKNIILDNEEVPISSFKDKYVIDQISFPEETVYKSNGICYTDDEGQLSATPKIPMNHIEPSAFMLVQLNVSKVYEFDRAGTGKYKGKYRQVTGASGHLYEPIFTWHGKIIKTHKNFWKDMCLANPAVEIIMEALYTVINDRRKNAWGRHRHFHRLNDQKVVIPLHVRFIDNTKEYLNGNHYEEISWIMLNAHVRCFPFFKKYDGQEQHFVNPKQIKAEKKYRESVCHLYPEQADKPTPACSGVQDDGSGTDSSDTEDDTSPVRRSKRSREQTTRESPGNNQKKGKNVKPKKRAKTQNRGQKRNSAFLGNVQTTYVSANQTKMCVFTGQCSRIEISHLVPLKQTKWFSLFGRRGTWLQWIEHLWNNISDDNIPWPKQKLNDPQNGIMMCPTLHKNYDVDSAKALSDDSHRLFFDLDGNLKGRDKCLQGIFKNVQTEIPSNLMNDSRKKWLKIAYYLYHFPRNSDDKVYNEIHHFLQKE